MKFKLIIALVSDAKTEPVIEAARQGGATGATVITSARGEGLKPSKTFLGLTLAGQVDVVLFLVEQHLSREILELIAEAGHFGDAAGVVRNRAVRVDGETNRQRRQDAERGARDVARKTP